MKSKSRTNSIVLGVAVSVALKLILMLNALAWVSDAAAAAPGSLVRAINCGGGAAGHFEADNAASGGETWATTASIDTSGVSDPAAQAVYQTERYGDFTYSFCCLVPERDYMVRLHFAEIFLYQAGERKCNVYINGVPVLSDYDAFAEAGARNTAVVESTTATADKSGSVTIRFETAGLSQRFR